MFHIEKNVIQPTIQEQVVKKTLAIGFFLFICVLIYLANTQTQNPVAPLVYAIPYGDKLGHFILYGVLALLVNFATGFTHFRSLRFPSLSIYLQLGSIVVLSFALAEELSQAYFPLRTLDAFDALFDVLGVGLFTWISAAIADLKKRQLIGGRNNDSIK